MSEKTSFEERRDLLERRANAVRSRLFLAIDALDARRHRVEELGVRAKKAAVPMLLSVAGVVVLVGAVGVGAGWYLVSRRRRRLSERFRDSIRSLDLVRPPSLGRRLVERVALTIASVVVSAIAKRAAADTVAGRPVFGIGKQDVKVESRPRAFETPGEIVIRHHLPGGAAT
jgi:hypothetical protein